MIHRTAHHIREHLFPTKKNGFIPRMLREESVFVLLGVGLALFSFAQLVRMNNYFGLTAEVYPAVVYALTNEDRKQNNLTPLSFNETLAKAAQLKANDMAQKGYFAHTSPEGVTPWYWFGQAGYKFIYAGENLAINYDESDAVHDAWLESPTHRANIMNEHFTEMGVATARGMYRGVPTTFVVELFGMPATTRVATAPTTTPPPLSASAPAPTVQPTVAAAPVNEQYVAGEAATPSPIKIIEEDERFVMAQNTDRTLEPGDSVVAPAPKLSFIKRLILNSDKIAGLIIQVIMVAAIISVAGMVAREYEKHHRKHMVYGTLVAMIMFAFLFAGGFGVFDVSSDLPLAAASVDSYTEKK